MNYQPKDTDYIPKKNSFKVIHFEIKNPMKDWIGGDNTIRGYVTIANIITVLKNEETEINIYNYKKGNQREMWSHILTDKNVLKYVNENLPEYLV